MQSIIKNCELENELLLKKLNSSRKGLSLEESIKLRKKFGENIIYSQQKRTALSIFISQFKNPLFITLFIASIVSGFLGEMVSTTIIIVMLSFSGIVSFLQEYHSEKTVELLKKRIALKAVVIRNGKEKEIFANELVVGDIVSISFGAVVPADIRLIDVNDLALDEAMLTGESFPVEKIDKPIILNDYIPQAMKNIAFMGTHVVSGSALGIVVATGKNTEFGRTAKMLESKEEKTEFQKGIADFSLFLFKIIIVFSFCIFIFLALFRGSWLASLLFSLSIAVGISPELLPMIITINLSRAARIMAKNNVIVKKLLSIEYLGNIDILCTDKTGTLTEGKIALKNYFDFFGKEDAEIINLSLLCTSHNNKSRNQNSLDIAVIKYAEKHKHRSLKDYEIIDDIAFDFKRRKMSVIVENKKRIIITKGAAEEMLDACSYININSSKKNIAEYTEKINAEIKKQESSGFKVLLLAYKDIEKKSKYTVADEKKLIFLGYLVFVDPPKETALASIAIFKKMGISLKLLTGDTKESAIWLAKETGFVFTKAIIGSELDKMSDTKFKKTVLDYDVFAKITPEHKLKIVKTLKECGKNVAFLGDGINDAPALHIADVGISVDDAVDVAKEAADIILLKKNLGTLIDGIKEGRKTFGNTLKYIFCTISSNYGNMFSLIGASIILPFIPLLPAQVLLLNLFSDLPLLAVSTDSVDEEYLKKPKHWDIEVIKKFMNYFGLVSSLFDFITYAFLLLIVGAGMSLFQVGWFWQSFLTEVLLIFVIRTRKWFWQSTPSKTLMYIFALTIILVLVVMYTPIAIYFGFAKMPVWVNISLIGIAICYFGVVETTKKMFYKKYDI